MTSADEPIGGLPHSEELKSWVAKQLNAAVKEILERGLFDAAVVEAKPAWVFPFTLLIGKIRAQGRSAGFDWFICGDSPLSIANSRVADTARDAARHFALQWQLEAAREGQGSDLAEKAAALHQLVEEDRLWQQAQ